MIASPDRQSQHCAKYIIALISYQEQEGKYIEYKSEPYRLDAADHDFKLRQHEELLKDVSSFANESGGDLIVGMKEENGIPTELCGFQVEDPDALKLRLTEILQKWLEPRVGFTIHSVTLGDEKNAFVIRIPRSLIAPHRVIYQGRSGHFWACNSAGAYTMDTMELRRAFTLSETIYDRMKGFRFDRGA